jgi:hypothetical protein
MMCERDEEPQPGATSRWKITMTCGERFLINNNFASSNNFNLTKCQNVTLSCNQNACQKKRWKNGANLQYSTTRPTRYLNLAPSPWGMNGGWTRETFPSSSSFLANLSGLVSSDFCFNYPLTNNLVPLRYVPTIYLPSSNLLSYVQDRLWREVEYKLSLGSSIPEQCFLKNFVM